ncbi:MAG: tetratricopeptide repeat protein [Pseudomonadota bacterium]|nr:tetratricopeptide repeat protein [Pseudomonadota bacterium]
MLSEAKLDTKNEKRLQQALDYQKTHQVDKALTLYQMILLDHPKHAMILHLIGITFAQIDNLEKAIVYFENALDIHPNHPIYTSSLANAQRRQGNTEQAIKTFEKAIDINPTLISAHNNLALIYFKSNPEKALSHLNTALEINPEHLDANYNMGIFLLPSNRHKAKKHLQRALNTDPDFVPAMFQLAQIYHIEKAHINALNLYDKILDINPTHPECLNKIGLIHLEQDNIDDGIEFLKKALSISSEITDIHHNLACCYLHKKEYQKALSHWMTHLKSNKDLDTYYNIGVCYLYLGRYDDCTDYLFHVIKKDPTHYESLINLGAAFLQKGHIESACDYYQRAQSIKPTPSVQYILSALEKKREVSTVPAEYVIDLFNNYAFHYDNHLVDVLDYQVPKRLNSILPALLNFSPNSLSCLDLGCGTGLAAVAIAPFKSHLTGVDLSPNMIEQANKKSIYDRLICQDILIPISEYLNKTDLVLTADTLPYFGDLNPVFSLVRTYLKPQGHWIFTIETTRDECYVLNQSARFSHNPNTIKQLSKSHDFDIFHSENIQLRTQQNQYIEGMIFILSAGLEKTN